MNKENIILNLLLVISIFSLIVSLLSLNEAKEAKINSHNAYQRSIHLNNDFVEAGLIKGY